MYLGTLIEDKLSFIDNVEFICAKPSERLLNCFGVHLAIWDKVQV